MFGASFHLLRSCFLLAKTSVANNDPTIARSNGLRWSVQWLKHDPFRRMMEDIYIVSELRCSVLLWTGDSTSLHILGGK